VWYAGEEVDSTGEGKEDNGGVCEIRVMRGGSKMRELRG
jgi:hypothetical protein